MPRKYNDPIMKSKNAQTNGGAASNGSDDGIQYTPGYIPETLKNGIDFSDLSDSLRKAIGGTYNFKTGDSSFNFIGGGNGVNLTSLSDIPNQIGQNGIDLASLLSMLNQNGDDANLLGLISAFGGGGEISLVRSTTQYEWFKLPISNKLTYYEGGLMLGFKYSLNLIVYHDVVVEAADQKIIYGDIYDRFWFKNANNEWQLGKPSFVPAARQSTIMALDTTDSTNNQVFKPIIEAERTSLTRSITTLETPTMDGDIVRDVGFILGRAYGSPYDETKRFVGATATLHEETSTYRDYRVTGQEESTDLGNYTMADSPLTYMYVSGDKVYNYSAYNMSCNIVRIIICNELS